MKTLKQWEKSGLDLEDFIHPGDWISEDLYNYWRNRLSVLLFKGLNPRRRSN